MTDLNLRYEYSPWRSQQGEEIPAFTIIDEEGECLADLNENQSIELQEELAALFAAAPNLLFALEAAGTFAKADDVSITNDNEALRQFYLAYQDWWKEQAQPAIAYAKMRLDSFENELHQDARNEAEHPFSSAPEID